MKALRVSIGVIFERIYKNEGLLKDSKLYGQETKQGEPKESRNHYTGQH